MFKFDNKDTRAMILTSSWCLLFLILNIFPQHSSVSLINAEHILICCTWSFFISIDFFIDLFRFH